MLKRVYFAILTGLLINGCAEMVHFDLEPVKSKKFGDTSKYTYAIIGQSQTLTSEATSGYIYGYGAITGGETSSVSKSINPSDVIAGILMKKGFIVLDSISNDKTKKAKSLFVKYGQSGRRDLSARGYTLEVSIQILDASTYEPIFTCTAEGLGHTEADDIRHAITRCLSDL